MLPSLRSHNVLLSSSERSEECNRGACGISDRTRMRTRRRGCSNTPTESSSKEILPHPLGFRFGVAQRLGHWREILSATRKLTALDSHSLMQVVTASCRRKTSKKHTHATFHFEHKSACDGHSKFCIWLLCPCLSLFLCLREIRLRESRLASGHLPKWAPSSPLRHALTHLEHHSQPLRKANPPPLYASFCVGGQCSWLRLKESVNCVTQNGILILITSLSLSLSVPNDAWSATFPPVPRAPWHRHPSRGQCEP